MLRLRLFLLVALLLPFAACDTSDPTADEVRRVFITEVEIANAPARKPDGSVWDPNTPLGLAADPDIYFDLVNDDTGTIIYSTENDDFNDIDAQDFPITWADVPQGDDKPLNEILFTRFDTPLAFDLWDSDSNDDDFMGSTGAFTIQQILGSATNPPTLFTVPGGGDISVRIRLRYER